MLQGKHFLMKPDSKIVEINSRDIDKAIQVFAKAMDFPIDVEQSILATAKLFLADSNLYGFAVQQEINRFIAFGGLIGMNGHTAWIPYVGVDPDHQHYGYGKIIMKALLNKARDQQWHSVELVASKAGYPLYQKVDFRTDYPVAIYEIEATHNSKGLSYLDTTIIPKHNNLPEWVLQFDQEQLGIDRSNIFPIHDLDKITLISHKDHGYGLMYGQRIGPVVSDTLEVARDIILRSYKLGATSFVVRNEDRIINFLSEKMQLKLQEKSEGTKMTYGKQINAKDSVICLRSMAFG